ncbi:MAG: hypothetical protein K1X67_03595 [Fimbriimonadaceae bacterium]|nr:hypothetical protein [Fimbriimonadaceae bacterium]
MSIRNVSVLALALPMSWFASCQSEPKSAAPSVKVEGKLRSYRLVRNGQPYFIKGVGGTGSRPLLLQCGANSIRTWGAENIGKILDEAHKDGLSVTVGVWLGHQDVFNYKDPTAVKKQLEMCRAVVERYKSHPAVLIWAFGNEMEGYGKGDDPAVWKAVNDIAAMSKSLDPNHPTMTVVAEIGGDRVKNLHELCPDIDIIGINSYGGAPSLPERYKMAGGTKPYILTEFGPQGPWEVKKTRWDAPIEMSSTEKGEFYRNSYRIAVKEQAGLCLGAYAFLWGNKQEGTATWFGMLLPDGGRLAATDVMTEYWKGAQPSNLVPRIEALALDKTDGLKPGEVITANLQASDPEGKEVKVKWVLTGETVERLTAGKDEAVPDRHPEAIIEKSHTSAKIKVPAYGGAYRLFAYVFDDIEGAAVANVPLFVEGPPKPVRTSKVELPLVVYSDGGKPLPFAPSGWMGQTSALSLDLESKDKPQSGSSCARMTYADPTGWGGIAWRCPANDWGDQPLGFDLSGAKHLSFWMRGAKGGEKVNVEFGIIGKDKKYFDTASAKLEIEAKKDWTRYQIALAGKDLSRIKTGFVVTIAGSGTPVTVFLDDVRFE